MEDVQEALRQVIEGADFTSPEKMLDPIKAEAACSTASGMPYSIATNVAHTEIWNRVWLNRLQGLQKVNPFPDFPPVTPEEWPGLKAAFLFGLANAYELACAEPFTHHCKSDDTAKRNLLKIAVHTSYHLGQINLLKRALRASHR